MRINHRRFQVFTRPPETAERTRVDRGDILWLGVSTEYCYCAPYSRFLAGYIPPEKTSSSSSRGGCESQGRSREREQGRETEREKEENHFISESDQRPRHAEENHQNFSLPCHKKGSPQRCELTIRVTLGEVANVRYRRADSPQRSLREHPHPNAASSIKVYNPDIISGLVYQQELLSTGGQPHLTEFQKPALPVRVEEGVCQVVPIILGDLKGLVFNTLIQVLQEKLGY